MREELSREYANISYQQPYQWAMYRLEVLTRLKRWRVEDYEKVVGSVEAQHVVAFAQKLLSRWVRLCWVSHAGVSVSLCASQLCASDVLLAARVVQRLWLLHAGCGYCLHACACSSISAGVTDLLAQDRWLAADSAYLSAAYTPPAAKPQNPSRGRVSHLYHPSSP